MWSEKKGSTYKATVILDDMDRYEYNQFLAAMEIGDHCGSLQEIINLTENLDCYDIYPDISDYDDLGRYYIEELDDMQVSKHLRNYIDYEAYGRDIDGVFTDYGYVRDTGDTFREYYDGERSSIPGEYRVITFQDNPLRTAEMTMEDNYGMIDEVMGNGRRGEEPVKAKEAVEKKPSIRERLEDAKRECAERKPPEFKKPGRVTAEAWSSVHSMAAPPSFLFPLKHIH